MFISLRTKLLPFCFYEERPQKFLCILSSNIFSSQPKEAEKPTSSFALLSPLPERKRKLHKKRSTRLVLLSLFSLLSSLVSVHLSRKTRNPIFFLLLFETIDFSERVQSISNLQCHTLFMILCFIASLFLWSSVFPWFSVPFDLFHSLLSWVFSNHQEFETLFPWISKPKSPISETSNILGLVLEAQILLFHVKYSFATQKGTFFSHS